jgi:ubiquinone/menaquinone biosynthesis C-methylase UbiE
MKEDEGEKPEGVVERALRKIGVENGQRVLDFGCGSGNHTIPAARVVGKEGKVYALDKNKEVLDALTQKAESLGLKNIRRIDTSGDTEIGLDDESVDVILLYDVLHSYYFPQADDRRKLLDEIYRVSKPDTLISVCPTHMETEKLKEEFESANFYLESEYSGMFVVHGNIEEGQLLNFKKGK